MKSSVSVGDRPREDARRARACAWSEDALSASTRLATLPLVVEVRVLVGLVSQSCRRVLKLRI